jgi:hypothetical protein
MVGFLYFAGRAGRNKVGHTVRNEHNAVDGTIQVINEGEG